MSTVKVDIKWSNGKTTLEAVELDKSELPALFKAQILTLTGVPIERQRLMYKGTVIKDEAWPENFQVENGSMFMLMGSSERLPEAPKEKPKFIEDMTESELAQALDTPTGLINLGNTCYISAVVQCLRTVPELKESLKKFDVELQDTFAIEPNNQNLTAALRQLYTMMEKSKLTNPIVFVRILRFTIPRLAQMGEGNTFQQQDANECWTELTRILQQNLKPSNENSKFSNFIDQYFSGVFEIEMKCDEAPDEPATKSEENFLQLSCFINQNVKYMQAGLNLSMKETLTKLSSSLNRDASYTKTSRINRLPAYLTIQFVRFHYKGNVQTNAKLLRDVKFSMILDVHDLCTKELQEKLAPMRAKYKLADDLMATAAKVDQKETVSKADGEATASGIEKENDSSTKDLELIEKARSRFLADDMDELKKYNFEDDPGSNNSGFYELKAVLTHKGRSSSSGHYVAWIKKENDWFKCDDEHVELVSADEILKLSGGGDWHCAYVCLYGPRFLELNKS